MLYLSVNWNHVSKSKATMPCIIILLSVLWDKNILWGYLQSPTKIIETNAKNGVVPVATSNVKLFSKTIWWGWKKFNYIFIWRRRSNESRDHYQEDGSLVPSPRCRFCFEAALRPKINHFRIHKKCYFPVKFVVKSHYFLRMIGRYHILRDKFFSQQHW